MERQKNREHWLVLLNCFCFVLVNSNHLESKRNNQTWKKHEEASWLGFKFIVLVTHAYERDPTKKKTWKLYWALCFAYKCRHLCRKIVLDSCLCCTDSLIDSKSSWYEVVRSLWTVMLWYIVYCIHCMQTSDTSQSVSNTLSRGIQKLFEHKPNDTLI